MNTIAVDQNKEGNLKLLAAQRQLYSDAKRTQAVQITFSVPVMLIASVAAQVISGFAVYAAIAGISITCIDLWLLTPHLRNTRLLAAKHQELFDCNVLELNWPELLAGRRPDAESVHAASSRYRSRTGGFDELRNWYPPEVEELPLSLARLVCQRSNCRWDSSLRRRFTNAVTVVMAVSIVALLILGVTSDLTLAEFVLAVATPLLPTFVLGMRQIREHRNAAESLDRMKDWIETHWNRALAGTLTSSDLEGTARILQDAIFRHRAYSPLIFDAVYQRLKRDHEEQMNVGARQLIEEALR